jgi:hypothetical protein
VTHGNATWVHADQDMAAPTVSFSVPPSVEGDLYLFVDEGDNQPLPIDKVTLLLPSYAVRLFRRPDLPLRLIYGQPDAASPRYDLQLLRGQVMGRLAEEVTAGAEQKFDAAEAASAPMVSPAVFWVVLSGAVLVLLGLVVKLMRREAI